MTYDEIKAVIEAEEELDVLNDELKDLRGRRQVKSVKSRIADIRERTAELRKILASGPPLPVTPSHALETLHEMFEHLKADHNRAMLKFHEELENSMEYAARWNLKDVIMTEATLCFLYRINKVLDDTEGSDLEILEALSLAVQNSKEIILHEYVYNPSIFNTSTSRITNLVEMYKHEAACQLISDYRPTFFSQFDELMAGVKTWKILEISRNIP